MTRNYKENLTLLGLVTLVLLSGIVLALPKAIADDGTTSNVAIRVNSACSVAVSPEGSNDTPHTADLNPGTYQANIGKTTIKTICNDSNGFSIYAVGYTNDEYGNTVLKSETLDASNSIVTGTATGAVSGVDTSNWAMKVSAVAGTYAPTIQSDTYGTFSDYHAVPSTFTKVASNSSITDASTGSSIEITYSAYIAGTQPADLYNGKVKFAMVHPATEQPLQPQTSQSGKICYFANASGYEGSMGCQDVASEVTLLASNFSRTGYGFAGWSDKFDYATNNEAKFYGPQETITLTPSDYQSPNKGLSLYAVWVKSQGNLQDTDKVATLCGTGTGSLTKADEATNILSQSITALSDARDNNTYAIAKLADGNCWMIENLRLESTASHNTDGSLAQGYHSSFIGLATAESSWADNSTASNSLYSIDGSTTATISGDNQRHRFPRYNNTNTSARASNPAPTSNGASMYSYGNYYTWAAAIADTTDNSSGDDHGTTSICPTGWRLPIGGIETTVDKSFGKLSVSLGGPEGGAIAHSSSTPSGYVMSDRLKSYPNNFVYSGEFTYGSVSRGSSGGYWTSTGFQNRAFSLYFYSRRVDPGSNYDNSKDSGMSIRCLATPNA